MQYLILFGGKSYEHEISIVSAIALKEKIKDALFVFIDEKRDFYLIDTKKLKSKLFSSRAYKKEPKLELQKSGWVQKGLFGSKTLSFDMVINLVHGGDGEDGKLAGLLDFFEIPYIGPRLEASVISFNKLFTKLYAKEVGCEVLDFQLVRKGEPFTPKFDYPFIIKPLRLGSSIGVSVVHDRSELDYALDVAFEFDDEALIEPFIENIEEFNLAGCKGSDFHFSMIEKVQKEKLLDFDKKYLDFSRSGIQKANIDQNLQNAIREAFIKIYEPLFGGALIRVDFFYHQGKIYINEINPVPGSMANYLFEDFISVLDDLARHLPKERFIPIEYRYINSIQSSKK